MDVIDKENNDVRYFLEVLLNDSIINILSYGRDHLNKNNVDSYLISMNVTNSLMVGYIQEIFTPMFTELFDIQAVKFRGELSNIIVKYTSENGGNN